MDRTALPLARPLQMLADTAEETIRRAVKDDDPTSARATQPTTIGFAGGSLPDGPLRRLRATSSGGVPLAAGLRRSLEHGFGADLSRLRVHTGSAAAELSRTMQAKAFTHGDDIYFRDGLPDQETAEGQHLLAHEVAHAVAADGTVHRALDPDAVLAAVRAVPDLQPYLGRQTADQVRDTRAVHGDENITGRVRKILQAHHEMFGADDAMSMAIAIDGISKLLAEEIFDNAQRPAIARHLLTTFKQQLHDAMPEVGRRGRDLRRARTIVSTDALGRYMHHERKVDDAAWDIHDAALADRMTPIELCQRLEQRFQAELASYSGADIAARQDTRGNYNQSESTGNISVNYVKELMGPTVDPASDNQLARTNGGDGMRFTIATRVRLAELRIAVRRTTQVGAVDPRPQTTGERRNRLLGDLQRKDQQDQQTRTDAVKAALQRAPWNLDEPTAARMIQRLQAGLTELPLTITHRAASRINLAEELDPVDRSRAGLTETRNIHGKDFSTPGQYRGRDVADRGADYMQFRSWKDRLMTGDTGMSGAEMPVFGAVNVNFNKYKGSETAGAADISTARINKSNDPRSKAERVQDKQTIKNDKRQRADLVGQNYYGDLHIVLKREAVAGRVVYTASDHGQPHTDPFLAFADFLLGSSGQYQADITRLKRPGAPGYQQVAATNMRSNFAKMVVATILGSSETAASNLPFEIMIHGEVNWGADAKEIWVAPSVGREYLRKLERWAKAAKGRPKIRTITPPKSGTVTTSRLMADSAIDLAQGI